MVHTLTALGYILILTLLHSLFLHSLLFKREVRDLGTLTVSMEQDISNSGGLNQASHYSNHKKYPCFSFQNGEIFLKTNFRVICKQFFTQWANFIYISRKSHAWMLILVLEKGPKFNLKFLLEWKSATVYVVYCI